MQHVLDINRKTAHDFAKKAKQFINLPRQLFECDMKKCNPNLYKGTRGKAAIRRAKKALVITKSLEKDLDRLIKILEV